MQLFECFDYFTFKLHNNTKNFIDHIDSFRYHIVMKRIIIANWKMNGSLKLIREFHSIQPNPHTDIVVCPPACYLSHLKTAPFLLGAQDCHWETSGAHTGEVSPCQLKELGCTYVIVGHSERRAQFNETNVLINKKAIQAIQQGLAPVICIGETYEERDENRFEHVLLSQIDQTTHLLNPCQYIIAYEPIWSIGTGLIPTPNDIRTVVSLIKKRLGDTTTIVYGGSVNDKNASDISRVPSLNGVLVGGASLKVNTFQAIVDAFQH